VKRFLVILICAFASEASAQELNLATTSTERPDIVRARTGVDHAFTAELGYVRVVALPDRVLLVGADLVLPWATPDLGDVELRLGAAAPVVEHGPWKLVARLGPTLRSAETVVSRMIALDLDARLAAGYHARRGFVAVEAAVDWAAATHVTHSDAYRDRVYADAMDGWYRSTGGTLRAGVYGGLSFERFDLVLRAGRPFAIDGGAHTIPLYATLGVNVTR
jgi:hypothetical protein